MRELATARVVRILVVGRHLVADLQQLNILLFADNFHDMYAFLRIQLRAAGPCLFRVPHCSCIISSAAKKVNDALCKEKLSQNVMLELQSNGGRDIINSTKFSEKRRKYLGNLSYRGLSQKSA